MQSYFTRVGQKKEQLETIQENVEEGEIVWPPWIFSLDHGIHSFKEYVPEGIWSVSTDFGKNAHKNNLES